VTRTAPQPPDEQGRFVGLQTATQNCADLRAWHALPAAVPAAAVQVQEGKMPSFGVD